MPAQRTDPPLWIASSAFFSLTTVIAATFAALCGAEPDKDAPAPTVTVAPVFLPYYESKSWSIVRGSILSSDTSETTYTIFCPLQTPQVCDLSLEFPFVIAEGKESLQFHGTYTSTYIVDVDCRLNKTTAATCFGYTSLKSGYSNGPYTGPTEISWTSTLSGTDVQWGSLTLEDVPQTSDNSLGVTATAITVPVTSVSGTLEMPSPTHNGSASSVQLGNGWALAVTMASAVIAAVLMS